jgi:type II secretory pathway component GspD/PulD (secretin)
MAQNFSTLTKMAFCSIRSQRRAPVFAACAMFLMLPISPAQSLEPKWPGGPYRYLVVDQDLRDILTEFGRNLNLGVQISDQVAGRRIRGRLPITTAKEFLTRLCESYGLVWYYDGAKLHINAENELRAEMVSLGQVNPATMKERLQELGIADMRYAITSTGDNSRVLSVSGPPRYLERIREAVAAMQKPVAPAPARNVQEVPNGDYKNVRIFRGGQNGS